MTHLDSSFQFIMRKGLEGRRGVQRRHAFALRTFPSFQGIEGIHPNNNTTRFRNKQVCFLRQNDVKSGQ